MKHNNEKILILGSNSFAASHFIEHALKMDYEILGISRSPNKRIKSKRFSFLQMNLNGKRILKTIDSFEPGIVINFAGQSIVQTSWAHPFDYFKTNIIGLSKIAHHLSKSRHIKKFIQMSTPEVYGDSDKIVYESKHYNPSTPYALSKAAFDMYLEILNKNYEFPYILIRASNWYGPHQQLFKIIPKTITTIKNKEKLPLDGNGISKRNFIYIDDAINGIQKIIENGNIGDTYHLATKEYTSIKTLVELICHKMDYSFSDLVEFKNERIGKDFNYILDTTKIRNELNWNSSIDINEGLNKTIQWINSDWKRIRRETIEYEYKK